MKKKKSSKNQAQQPSKTYSIRFKRQIVSELLTYKSTIERIEEKYGIPSKLVYQWCNELSPEHQIPSNPNKQPSELSKAPKKPSSSFSTLKNKILSLIAANDAKELYLNFIGTLMRPQKVKKIDKTKSKSKSEPKPKPTLESQHQGKTGTSTSTSAIIGTKAKAKAKTTKLLTSKR